MKRSVRWISLVLQLIFGLQLAVYLDHSLHASCSHDHDHGSDENGAAHYVHVEFDLTCTQSIATGGSPADPAHSCCSSNSTSVVYVLKPYSRKLAGHFGWNCRTTHSYSSLSHHWQRPPIPNSRFTQRRYPPPQQKLLKPVVLIC